MACGKISLIFVLLLLGVATVVKGRKMIILTKEEVFSVVEGSTVNRLVFSIGNVELQGARRAPPYKIL